MYRFHLVHLFFLLSLFQSQAQDITQTLSGRVKDPVSLRPIAQAHITLHQGSEQIKGTVSDSLGYFLIREVEPGRYKLIVSFTGYSSYESELLVVSGKSQRLEIFIQESQRMLEEVVVSPHAVTTSNVISIPIEKALRIPANFFDPVRMLTAYPGVIAASDQANSIIVKGYSPNGILWRLQGLDIINPNHTANAGTLSDKPTASGGGVNVLSAQLLDRTDFYSGTLPVQYGNALSGAMDLTLRPGNNEKTQYTAQASLIGLDVSAEGPLSSSKKGSFIANYRYSTVGLLSDMGVDFGGEKIHFQDFSFHLNMPSEKGGNLSAFGFGGLSSNVFNAREESEWVEEKDRYSIHYTGKVYGVGLVNQFKPGWMSVSAGASISGQYQERSSESIPVPQPHISSEYYLSERALLSTFIKGVRKIGKEGFVETGLRANYINTDVKVNTVSQFISESTPNYSGMVSGMLWQPYVAWSQAVGKFTVGAGLRYVHFGYNNSSSLEPRASIASNWNSHVLTLAYSKASQLQQADFYVMGQNKGLDFTTSHQFSLAWNKRLPADYNLLSSVYYHQLENVPMLGSYSLINQWDELRQGNYRNGGKGRNYGVEAQLEKRYYSDIYFMVSGSVFQSEYHNGSTYLDSRFNGRFTSSLLGGKEWKKTRKSFGMHVRVLYNGGLSQAPIDVAASSLAGTTMFDYTKGYTAMLPSYFRTDLRLSWRKNKPGYTRTLSLDIQNLTSQQNVAFQYYDTYLQGTTFKYQLGIIPVLAYRIEF